MATEEGPKNLQADQDQAQPGGECVTSEEQPPQPTMPTKDQQEGWQSAKAKEIHPTESCQVTLGDEEEGMGTHGGGQKALSAPNTEGLVLVEAAHWSWQTVSLGPGMVLAVGITVFPSGLVSREALWVSWGQGRARVV